MAANTWMSIVFLGMTVDIFVVQGKRQLFRLQICDIRFWFCFSFLLAEVRLQVCDKGDAYNTDMMKTNQSIRNIVHFKDFNLR